MDGAGFSASLAVPSATVNEIQRLSYLDAMGIESYISRSNLVGAAPTRRLAIAARVTAAVSQDSGQVPVVDVRARLGPPDEPPAASAKTTTKAIANAIANAVPEAPAQQSSAATDNVPVFSLVATLAGGRLWLEEIPRGREPGPDYQQLLLAICSAQGWSVAPPQVDVFNWPMNSSAQLDHGVDAARQGVRGFLQGRLDRHQPQGVILLGPLDLSWFEPGLLALESVLELPAAWHMLRQPGLKRQAWKILRSLSGSGG